MRVIPQSRHHPLLQMEHGGLAWLERAMKSKRRSAETKVMCRLGIDSPHQVGSALRLRGALSAGPSILFLLDFWT